MQVRVTVKLTPEGREFPVRFIVSNESGYYLNIQIYKEVFDVASGACPGRARVCVS
jgi:hypothetical protein